MTGGWVKAPKKLPKEKIQKFSAEAVPSKYLTSARPNSAHNGASLLPAVGTEVGVMKLKEGVDLE